MRYEEKKELHFGRMRFTRHVYDKVNVEDMLAHKSREVLFHLKTRRKWACSLVAARIRNDLVRSDLNG